MLSVRENYCQDQVTFSGAEPSHPTTSYVAVSRVKTLNRLLFEVPFDYERFTGKESAVSRDCELDYTYRNTQLL